MVSPKDWLIVCPPALGLLDKDHLIGQYLLNMCSLFIGRHNFIKFVKRKKSNLSFYNALQNPSGELRLVLTRKCPTDCVDYLLLYPDSWYDAVSTSSGLTTLTEGCWQRCWPRQPLYLAQAGLSSAPHSHHTSTPSPPSVSYSL